MRLRISSLLASRLTTIPHPPLAHGPGRFSLAHHLVISAAYIAANFVTWAKRDHAGLALHL